MFCLITLQSSSQYFITYFPYLQPSHSPLINKVNYKYCDRELCLMWTYVFNVSASIVRQKVKVRPMRSSLKLICELIRKFKEHIHPDFVNAMKKTPFGAIFMAFYNEKFGGDKSLKLNIGVLKIIDQYDRKLRTFLIGGKQIELTV